MSEADNQAIAKDMTGVAWPYLSKLTQQSLREDVDNLHLIAKIYHDHRGTQAVQREIAKVLLTR